MTIRSIEERLRLVYRTVRLRLRRLLDRVNYQRWVMRHPEVSEGEPPTNAPLISVLMPVYNVKACVLMQAIDSVRRQSYPHWQLCMVDDCSTQPTVWETMQRYRADPRIMMARRSENGGISRATNDTLAMAQGEFVALMDCDDTLALNALWEAAARLQEKPDTDMLYSDEDLLSAQGAFRSRPLFKPDWSPDTLLSYMYTCHLSLYRRVLVQEVGGLRPEMDGAQDYDLALRITEKTSRIEHIAKVLYHWRQSAGSTARDADAKPYALVAAHKAREEALARRGISGEVRDEAALHQARVVYTGAEEPLVSIIIPSKDHPSLLRTCVESVRAHAGYARYEIVVVDNGSDEERRAEYERLAQTLNFRYFWEAAPFNFAQMCNRGAALANGELLLFLNDDVRAISDGWLRRMAFHAMQKHAGAVGGKLLSEDGTTLQHIGVRMLRDGPLHWYYGQNDDTRVMYYANSLENNYLAVTGACLMVRRAIFGQVGGFDESFAVNYNDVELCMRLYEAGYFNVLRADAVLVHAESVSRGKPASDDAKLQRLRQERERLYERHPRFRQTDPFHNPNLRADIPVYAVDASR